MADESALLIDEVLGSQAAGDGQHALFKVKTSGQEIAIAFPEGQLINLISASATAAKECQRIIQQQPDLKMTLPVQWWEFGLSQDGNFAVLSFRLPGGGEISFSVPSQWISQMRGDARSDGGTRIQSNSNRNFETINITVVSN